MLAVQGFPPLISKQAVGLILGSMPGQASLQAGQYYAHPRNSFWPIMGALFAAYPELDYTTRVNRLLAEKMAVWDVLKHCQRSGSLDANIVKDSMITNDFNQLFSQYRQLQYVFFNGATAEISFRKHVLPHLTNTLHYQRLPSTSPAHASLSYQQKLHQWQQALSVVGKLD